MTRAGYVRHLLLRFADSALVAAGAWYGTVQIQRERWLPAASPAWGLLPFLASAFAYVALGAKQRRPVYLKRPGSMYVYAGVPVDRNAGCRGGLVTGATGSGKTIVCILPQLHSLCVNESGIEREDWRGSPSSRRLMELRKEFLAGKNSERGQDALAKLREFSDASRRIRYRIPPWGGLVCGEKGNEWQTLRDLLTCHCRPEDLCVLGTRPEGAPADWSAPVRFNLLSMDEIPADTYARMFVDTFAAIEGAGRQDEFFVSQARNKIAWGIRLLRTRVSRSRVFLPSAAILMDILTVEEGYRQFLLECSGEGLTETTSGALAEARYQLEGNYWNQPPEQLGGVKSTIHNFLSPFTEPEIAEVFSRDSTFNLRDIELGKVVCLAIPQKHAIQRRYVGCLLKSLVYQIAAQRFDHDRESEAWRNRNVLVVEQDEWQRNAVKADCETDIAREALGAVYAATQSQNAVWLKLGGRENAVPVIANLRNRWICQAATDECAEESVKLISERRILQSSRSTGPGGSSVTTSFADRPFVTKAQLRTLPSFHVYFVPAEGRWLYKKCLVMPVSADGTIPDWWFGDWNVLRWLAVLLKLPETIRGLRLYSREQFVAPWNAKAPARAQCRRLLGLDGTFIVIEKMSVRRAAGLVASNEFN